jgi:hypothetical protein
MAVRFDASNDLLKEMNRPVEYPVLYTTWMPMDGAWHHVAFVEDTLPPESPRVFVDSVETVFMEDKK